MSCEANTTCQHCGKRFYCPPFRLARGLGKGCSVRCSLLIRGRIPYTERFWKHVEKTDGCWLWTGCLSPKGYGKVGDYDGTTKRDILAHRVSYEMHKGAIPDGLFVLHDCDNPRCVNPDHLFVGTNNDNVADMVSKGRQARGRAKPIAKLTDDSAREILCRHAAGERPGALAREYGMSPPSVSDLLHGRTWKHVSMTTQS